MIFCLTRFPEVLVRLCRVEIESNISKTAESRIRYLRIPLPVCVSSSRYLWQIPGMRVCLEWFHANTFSGTFTSIQNSSANLWFVSEHVLLFLGKNGVISIWTRPILLNPLAWSIVISCEYNYRWLPKKSIYLILLTRLASTDSMGFQTLRFLAQNSALGLYIPYRLVFTVSISYIGMTLV